ncbi:MAG: FAD-dependent monooxygenase, partial [Xanthomonadales bacterium]|nr:FAD-dependent monooxygenase [Xanthomonadales bacterium]
MRSGSRDALDALIIGAGMVGGAVALGLARSGLKVALVEQHPVSAPTPAEAVDARVVAVAPHSQRLLSSLGVWGEIAAVRASPYSHMQVQDALGASTLDFDAADYGWPCLGHIVENRLIAGTLWHALE